MGKLVERLPVDSCHSCVSAIDSIHHAGTGPYLLTALEYLILHLERDHGWPIDEIREAVTDDA